MKKSFITSGPVNLSETMENFILQAYCYMVDKYIKTLILVIQLRPKPMMMHLALRLIHTACRYTQELKARIGGEFELTKVRVGDPAVNQITRVW